MAAHGNLRPASPWLAFALLASAAALGASRGAGLGAVAAGLLLAPNAPPGQPSDDASLVAEAEGRVCGLWRTRPEFASRNATFCPDWLRQGGRWIREPPELRLDLPADRAPPPFGSRLRARGTLSRFAGFANETEVGPGPWRWRVKSFALGTLVDSPSGVARWSAVWRRFLDDAIRRTRREANPGVALARALVLGDESAIGDERRRALRRAGLSHLLAVSGFNLTVVAALAASAGALFARRGRLALPILAAALYLAAVGPEPSMLRATAMTCLGLTLVAVRRPGGALQILAVAGCLLVAFEPRLVEEVGFQLSLGATAGLVIAAERWTASVGPGRWRAVRVAMATTLAAQLGALPFAVAAFGEISPAAPLWNLLFVPWATICLLASMLWIALAAVAPALARATAPWLDVGAVPFGWLESLPASPWISCGLPGGLLAGTLVTCGVVVVLEWRVARALCVLSLLGVLLTGARADEDRVGGEEVVFFDVGQGDAALVRRGRVVALIDGGGLIGRDLGASVLRPALERRGVTRVDLVLLSHSDRDHCRGLVDLAREVPIGELWSSPGQLDGGCGAELANRAGGGVRGLRGDESLERGGIRFEVLHAADGTGRSDNADSLVVAIELGGRRFLFTGDLEASEERALVAGRAAALHATVLKVAHHGSKGSSTGPFLAAVGARAAVVSAGVRNGFGHPAAQALGRVRAAGSVVLRTDLVGEIRWFRPPSGGPWRLDLPASPRRVPGVGLGESPRARLTE